MTEQAAPYPADTRAKGWRFEIDHERIFDQSDTWSLAPAEIKPWLLMMWLVAWRQTPCGSLPDDDQLIAARMGMPTKLYEKHRLTLRRGWWKASDGRLYHSTIADRVRSMLDKRMGDAERAASRRARKADSAGSPTGVTGVLTDESRVTPTGVHPEFDTKHQAPSTKEKNPPNPRKRGNVHEFPPGFDRFWSAYPRKIGKDKAAQAFAKRKPDVAMVDAMVAAIEAQKRTEQWRKDGGQFIPHPTTWLNDGRWMDEVESSDVPPEMADMFSRGRA